MAKNSMVTEKTWAEFRQTGLLLIINQILHIFGWAIVFEFDKTEVTRVYPARVKFRGFEGHAVSDAYENVTSYLAQNINDLSVEAIHGNGRMTQMEKDHWYAAEQAERIGTPDKDFYTPAVEYLEKAEADPKNRLVRLAALLDKKYNEGKMEGQKV